MDEKVKELIEKLSIRNPESIEAAKELGRLGFDAVCAALETPEKLNSPGGRHALSKELSLQEPKKIIPRLVGALGLGDWRPTMVATDALCAIGEATIPALSENLLEEASADGRNNTILVLQRLGGTEAAENLAKVAKEDKTPEVRATAITALGRLGAENAASAIIEALCDKSELVKKAASRAAGWLKVVEAADGIVKLLGEFDPTSRAYAIYALDRIGDASAAPAVIGFLKDDDPYVRWSAAAALRRLWTDESGAALEETLSDGEDVVASAALETLCLKSPETAKKHLKSARKDSRALGICHTGLGGERIP